MRAFFECLEATSDNSDVGPAYLAQLTQYLSDLESIAADPALPADERDIAKEALDDFGDHARQIAGEALKVLASMDGEEAQSALTSHLTKLQKRIDDPHTPEELRLELLQIKRALYSS